MFLARTSPRLQLEVYDEARPIAYSLTTYLDTDDSAYLLSGDSGVHKRVRIREYGAAATTSAHPVPTGVCFMEYKENCGADRNKQRIRVPRDELGALYAGRRLAPIWVERMNRLPALWPVGDQLAVGLLRPHLTILYRRVSLSGARVRVTIDEGVAVCRPVGVHSWRKSALRRATIGYLPGRIFEVKVAGAAPAWLTHAMAALPEAKTRSKFEAGMAALRGSTSSLSQRRTCPLPALGNRETECAR